jgi:membrane dipeptidase
MRRWLILAVVVACPIAADAQDDAALQRARALLQRVILVDGHNDLPWAIRESEKAPMDVEAYDLRKPTPGHTDLARLREGGVGAQFWSVYVPGEARPEDYVKMQLEQIDLARRITARYPEALALALSTADIRRAKANGRIACLLGAEGGHTLRNSLATLRSYYDLGVRYLTLTHNVTLDWADAASFASPRHGGLTRFGEEVVREMNRLGMLVDLSHVTPDTMDDALRVSEAPVIFSHSSARAVADHVRNVPDAILKRLPPNGGVVMVTFVAAFVSQEYGQSRTPLWQEYQKRTEGVADRRERERIRKEVFANAPAIKVTLGEVADHIDHIRKLAGVDHVGIGGDYDGNDSWPEGLEDVSKYPYLFAELIRRGWSDADLEKLAGANLLRAFAQAESVAARLQKARPPSSATIEQLDGPSR